MVLNEYDSIANVYDNISGLVFGNDVFDAQLRFLKDIQPNGKVLILGGGTGWLLKYLPSGTRVCFIDASSKMIQLAKKKCPENMEVQFIHGTQDDIPAGIQFDAIITHFYLDLFKEEDLKKLVEQIGQHINPRGIWLAADFMIPQNKSHKRKVKWMLWVFRNFFNHPNRKITHWESGFEGTGWKIEKSTFYHQGLIKSVLMKRG